MSPVTKSEQTAEEKRQEGRDVKQRQDDVAEDILNDLGFGDEEDQGEDQKQEEEVQEEEQEDQEDSQDEEESQEEEQEEGEVEDDEEEEDVVPVSTMKKRINSEKARNQVLEAKNKELEEKLNSSKNESTRKGKLETKTVTELKQLRADAKSQLRELIRNGDDPQREAQIDDLIDEINEVIAEAPARFQKEQIALSDKAVQEVMADPENEKIDWEDAETIAKIKELRNHLYNKYPDLQKIKSGQATALKMAVEHFREVGLPKKNNKKEIRQLKQKNNKLKRKSSLDEGTQKKGLPSKETIKKTRSKLRDEPNLIKRTSFVESLLEVDKYLPKNLR